MGEQDPQATMESGISKPADATDAAAAQTAGANGATGPGDVEEPRDATATVTTERRRAYEQLSSRAASGGLTLDEFAQQATAIEGAGSVEDVRAVLAEAPPEATASEAKDSPRWLFNVFGGTDQRGRWRLGRRLRIFAFLGGANLDLGAAQPAAPECVISVLALLGGVELTAPTGVTVQLSGVSLLGGKTDERAVGPSLPGSPLIRVRAFAVLGGVKIGERKRSRSAE